MPNINLRDGRNRDALVRAESTAEYATVAYVDQDGLPAKSRKVLKATADMSFERLVRTAGDDAKLADALVAGDPDTDVERIGMFLSDTSRVFVNEKDEIVYQIEQVEIVRGPSGEVKERRPRRRPEPNVDSEIPISWTGRKVAKDEALRRFVFSSKLQIMHVNGLTYDFLYGMAKELADANALMLLGAGKSGKEPLMFQRGSTPYRGFLEGRIEGDKYMLILHLSKLELKRPAEIAVAAPAVVAVAAPAAQPAAQAPTLHPAAPPPVPAAEPVPKAVQSHQPTAREVIAQLDATSQSSSARAEIGAGVGDAKAVKQGRTKASVSAKATSDGAAAGVAPKPARKPRAAKAKPDATTPND